MQIDYTSRDFTALKADLINLIKTRTNTKWDPTDYSDLGNVLVETFAYMGDIMSHYLDRVANETAIDTAIKTDTLLAFARLYDYKPSGPTPASLYVNFTNTSDAPIDIPIGTQVMAALSYGPFTQVYFETTQSVTALASDELISILCKEGKTVNTDRADLIDATYNKALPANLGSSDGSADQRFTITDVGVIDNSITVYVGQAAAFAPWFYVESLLESGPNDSVFTTERNSDGTVAIVFGDGTNGAIPSSGQLISSVYKSSVGIIGNIGASQISEITFVPGNIDPEVLSYFEVGNSLPAYGGADADKTDQLRSKIKSAIKSRSRAVTLQDYANLASLVSQVGKTNAAADVYSSVVVYLQTQNDNSAAPGYPSKQVFGATGNGSAITYTTAEEHGFSSGTLVSISGVLPTTLNVASATIASVPTTTTFTVASTVSATSTAPGTAINLVPTATWNAVAADVSKYLSDKKPVGATVTVLPPTYVPIYLTVALSALPQYKNTDVKLSVYKKLLGSDGLFNYTKNVFGAAIPLSSVIAELQNVPGVVSTNITVFNTTGASSAGSITLSNNEIPFLTATNLIITVTGGI
jgi:hypothetical protein